MMQQKPTMFVTYHQNSFDSNLLIHSLSHLNLHFLGNLIPSGVAGFKSVTSNVSNQFKIPARIFKSNNNNILGTKYCFI